MPVATHRIEDEDRPIGTPLGTHQLLGCADKDGAQIAAFCRSVHRPDLEISVRHILGVLSLAKKYGGASGCSTGAANKPTSATRNKLWTTSISRNPKMSHSLVFDLAICGCSGKREAAIVPRSRVPENLVWPGPSDKPSFSRATACPTGETHVVVDDLAESVLRS